MTTKSEKKSPRPTRLEDVGRKMDQEIEELISWLNDEVVPSIRNHSTKTLRKASDKLARFADYVEQNRGRS